MGCLFMTLTYVWIFIQRPYHRQSLFTVTAHLVLSMKTWHLGKSVHSSILKSSADPMGYQRRLWQAILDLNGHTDYAKDYCLNDMSSLEVFRKEHPLTGYQHFKSYIERMLNGEKNVLVNGLPDSYIQTTGTTGKPKYIPVKNKLKHVLLRELALTYYITRLHHPLKLLSKILYLYVQPSIKKTESGTEIDSATAIPEVEGWLFAQFNTPPTGMRIASMHEAFYVHLLFALLNPDLGVVYVCFINALESAMKLLEKQWKNLTRDIELGTLNNDLNLEPSTRESLSSEMRRYGGDPARASQLRREFEKGFDGIIKRIWPLVPVIIGIDTTGSWPNLGNTYAKGIPLLTVDFGCSEADIGFSPGRKPFDEGYVPLVDIVILEFIKQRDMALSQPPTLFLDEIEQDELYEVVITQPRGLYRYRMGDVIKVLGFYNNMPIIDILYRTGQMMNLLNEKMDQRVVLESMREATAGWTDRTLIEYAVAESPILTPLMSLVYEEDNLVPYYLFFLEMKTSMQPLSDRYTELIDTELQSRNSDYAIFRSEGAISQPRVRLVRRGAFSDLERYLIANTGACDNQYKVPRKLRTPAMVQFMVDNLVFSK